MPADLHAVAIGPHEVGMMDHPGAEPQHLLLQRTENRHLAPARPERIEHAGRRVLDPQQRMVREEPLAKASAAQHRQRHRRPPLQVEPRIDDPPAGGGAAGAAPGGA